MFLFKKRGSKHRGDFDDDEGYLQYCEEPLFWKPIKRFDLESVLGFSIIGVIVFSALACLICSFSRPLNEMELLMRSF